MHKYVIEREISGVGSQSAEQLARRRADVQRRAVDPGAQGPVAAELRHRRQGVLRLHRRRRTSHPRAAGLSGFPAKPGESILAAVPGSRLRRDLITRTPPLVIKYRHGQLWRVAAAEAIGSAATT